MQVEVIRSHRRRKTVHARQVGDTLQLSIPATMSASEERHWVEEMTRRFERRAATGEIDLDHRSEMLAKRYRLPKPSSIRWVDNQVWRWASCTPDDGSIRLSTRLAGFPLWVIDYVIVHELAHLVVAGHSKDFWQLVARYPRTERARGFLIAKGMEDEDGATPPAPTDPPAAPRSHRPASARPPAADQPALW